ncbi:hypothetical protein C8R46DRAFT_1047928 [Mycena filopes]|nr:hypothetical protein C8R46DRAFT_1047928 [Mycena filopes]
MSLCCAMQPFSASLVRSSGDHQDRTGWGITLKQGKARGLVYELDGFTAAPVDHAQTIHPINRLFLAQFLADSVVSIVKIKGLSRRIRWWSPDKIPGKEYGRGDATNQTDQIIRDSLGERKQCGHRQQENLDLPLIARLVTSLPTTANLQRKRCANRTSKDPELDFCGAKIFYFATDGVRTSGGKVIANRGIFDQTDGSAKAADRRPSSHAEPELYQPAYGTTLALKICRSWRANEPSYKRQIEVLLLSVATLFAFTQLRQTLPGVPPGTGGNFVQLPPVPLKLKHLPSNRDDTRITSTSHASSFSPRLLACVVFERREEGRCRCREFNGQKVENPEVAGVAGEFNVV